jgi:adenylate kinase
MDVILFGPPGAGKGTQAGQISRRLGIPHVSTGDLFRYHIKNETELGLRVKSILAAGELVGDDVVFDLVQARLELGDAQGGLLFDGFPRTVRQVELLEGWMSSCGRRMDAILNMQAPDDVLVARISGRRTCAACGAGYHVLFKPPPRPGMCGQCDSELHQRADDHPSVARDRIETYYTQTAPVLTWMRDNERNIIDIDAIKSISDVRQAVYTALDALQG